MLIKTKKVRCNFMYVENNYYITKDDCQSIGLLGVEELEPIFDLASFSCGSYGFKDDIKCYGISVYEICFNDEIEEALNIFHCPNLYLVSVLWDWKEDESEISTNDFEFYLIDECELNNIFNAKFNNIYVALNEYINDETYLLPYRGLLNYFQENYSVFIQYDYKNLSDKQLKAIDVIYEYANEKDLEMDLEMIEDELNDLSSTYYE